MHKCSMWFHKVYNNNKSWWLEKKLKILKQVCDNITDSSKQLLLKKKFDTT